MLYEIVGFIPHGRIRISDDLLPVLSPGQPREQVYIPLKEHIIKVAEIPVYVFIVPACVFRKLLIILIGVAGLNLALSCAFLEYFIFIVSHPYRF